MMSGGERLVVDCRDGIDCVGRRSWSTGVVAAAGEDDSASAEFVGLRSIFVSFFILFFVGSELAVGICRLGGLGENSFLGVSALLIGAESSAGRADSGRSMGHARLGPTTPPRQAFTTEARYAACAARTAGSPSRLPGFTTGRSAEATGAIGALGAAAADGP